MPCKLTHAIYTNTCHINWHMPYKLSVFVFVPPSSVWMFVPPGTDMVTYIPALFIYRYVLIGKVRACQIVEKWPCGYGYMASPRCQHFSSLSLFSVNKDYNKDWIEYFHFYFWWIFFYVWNIYQNCLMITQLKTHKRRKHGKLCHLQYFFVGPGGLRPTPVVADGSVICH